MADEKEPKPELPAPADQKKPVEVAGPVATWSCETQVTDQEPITPMDELYVGDKYLLHCKGDVVVDFDKAKAKLEFKNEEQTYSLNILDLRTMDEDDLWAVVTSYKPGEHSFEGVSLTDGKTVIALSGEKKTTIKSALAERPKQEAMNPDAAKIKFFGPFALVLPMWVWISFFGTLTIILVVAWRVVSKRLQKKKLIEELAKHATALSPYHQFHKEIRQHIRKHTSGKAEVKSPKDFIGDIDLSFRMFLVREFLIPATEWKSSAVMGELKSQHKRTYRYAGPSVRKLLVEFDRAKTAGERNKAEDCDQMIDMTRRVVDQIQKLRSVQK